MSHQFPFLLRVPSVSPPLVFRIFFVGYYMVTAGGGGGWEVMECSGSGMTGRDITGNYEKWGEDQIKFPCRKCGKVFRKQHGTE